MLCQNIVYELGFGQGMLQTHHYSEIHAGAPFVIPGMEFDERVAIPGLESLSFDYYNPSRDISFQWFKYNIMCRHHPWICYPGQTKDFMGYESEWDRTDATGKRDNRGTDENSDPKRQNTGTSSFFHSSQAHAFQTRHIRLYNLRSGYTKRQRMQKINKCRSKS